MKPNDEVERRGVALTTHETDLSRSSTSLRGLPKTPPRDRSNRLLGHYARLPSLEFFPKHPAQRRFVHRRGAYGLAQRLID